MPESTSTVLPDLPPSDAPRRTAPRRRRVWRQGGTSVQYWNLDIVAAAVIGLGVGVIGGNLASLLVGGAGGALLGTAIVWVAMLAVVVFALRRSVPRELFRFRPVDLLYGLVLGVVLRIVQGWLDIAAGGGGWPSYPSAVGRLPDLWWTDVIVAGTGSPVVEELFFRGVLLVALFTVLRRMVTDTRAAAGIGAAVLTTALFVLVHALMTPLGWAEVVSLTVVGFVTAALVLLTGRIWGAVAVHIVYNLSFVLLTIAGTLAG